MLKDDSLAAAAGGRPRRPDEQPAEGIGGGGTQAFGEAEEVRRFPPAHIRAALVAQQSCWGGKRSAVSCILAPQFMPELFLKAYFVRKFWLKYKLFHF